MTILKYMVCQGVNNVLTLKPKEIRDEHRGVNIVDKL